MLGFKSKLSFSFLILFKTFILFYVTSNLIFFLPTSGYWDNKSVFVPRKLSCKRQQLGTTNNLLTYFEWANADEDVFMCLLKEVSVIVARRMLSKRSISCCQLPQYKKKETNTKQCRQQSSLAVEHKRKHLKNC